MPESTPLLPRSNKPPHEHPIFLRVCHAPWSFVDQKILLIIRGVITVYLTAMLVIAIVYEMGQAQRGELFLFKASVASFVLQVVYYLITTNWTFQHLSWPRVRESTVDGGFLTRVMRIFSIPGTRDFSLRQRLVFSIFYTSATTFPFVVAFLYWFVLDDGEGYAVGHSPLGNITNLNLNGTNALIALFEIMILSSVHLQKPFASHLAGVLVIVGLYFIWAGIGHEITRQYVYKQLDPGFNGKRGIVMTVLTTVSVTITFLLMTLGFHKLRDYATAKADCNRQNQ